ncbi:MAG TPA: hypothetical protein VEU51_18405 [Candidatus Acidoferrales bacterium]|nr:hypothetical protein [Candidatus Acidoferrales bacterium]
MAAKSRGIVLTIFAVLFALMALSNFSKPLHMSSNVGFVFLGTKLTGIANLIVAPLFGLLLAIYAYGIWTMRRFALPIAHFYATYVILNLLLFTINNRATGNLPPLAGWIGYIVVAVGVSLGSAVMLTRRKADLA